jgi:Protein of unknown function (DUF2683)
MENIMISLNENASRILNNIKVMYDFDTDSEAVEFMASPYTEEPELRPEYIEKMKEIDQEESIHIGNPRNLDAYIKSLSYEDEDV